MTARTRRSAPFLLTMVLTTPGLFACGTADPLTDPAPSPSPTPPTVAIGATLHCVSAPSTETFPPAVIRAEITAMNDGGFSVQLAEATHFFERADAGQRATTTTISTFEAAPTARDDGALQLASADDALLIDADLEALGWRTARATIDGAEIPLTCGTAETFATRWPRFDDEVGGCVDVDGVAAAPGVAPLALVQAFGDGACVDLRGAALNGDDLGYPILRGWDLRGALLDEASVLFADLLDADLRGAQLARLQYGYAHVTGRIDDDTALPEAGRCVVEQETLACEQ